MRQLDVVGAVIRNEDNEILCALRGSAMSLSGYWEFPGGKIEPGETPEETLSREILEELDCEIEVGELVEDHTHNYDDITIRLRTYEARVVQRTPKPLEHDRLQWTPINRLSDLNWAVADWATVITLLEREGLSLHRPSPAN